MKLLKWTAPTTLFTFATLALVACGGGGGSGNGGTPGGKTCTSNAQCGANESCVFSTSTANVEPLDFHEGEGGEAGFGGDGFGGSGGEGTGGTDSSGGTGGTDSSGGSSGSGTTSGTCQSVGGTGGSSGGGSGGAGGDSGSSGSSGSGGSQTCDSEFLTGSTFYKGDVPFGQCDDPGHPKNCQYGYFIKTANGCVCTAPCNTGSLPKVGEACSTDGSWTCQTIQNSSGASDWCVHGDLNLCQAG